MAIVGISGSPIIDGNTDRMTMAILDKSGRDTKFINLVMDSFFWLGHGGAGAA